MNKRGKQFIVFGIIILFVLVLSLTSYFVLASGEEEIQLAIKSMGTQ